METGKSETGILTDLYWHYKMVNHQDNTCIQRDIYFDN